ncbi:AraC family transcriptional regulator [Mucilaginibacter robiniae]|uniref:AraC family transcriptional regulator n=1 Tax=Mucilaginibacter robiniae TaxID=2728022 RepID=A0A7L5DUP3_9SPHI|nr:AraC family transcriptional regulator [Mucilaginibacter robiniae]QJD94845.1 AraC family transcriptional regulator [Mucilaginibacter robiniae]
MEQLTTQEYLIQIDKHPKSVYVLHERTERRFPVHHHAKGQITYVEGGVAYLHVDDTAYIIPARHYVWVPCGLNHFLKVRHSASAIRSIYFYTYDDDSSPFYSRMGIYPVNNLLHEMMIYTGQWRGHIHPESRHYSFFTALKNLLSVSETQNLPIVLPTTQNDRLQPVLQYLDTYAAQLLTLSTVSQKFGLSERTLSRLFQSTLSMSFLQYLKQLRMVKAVELMLQTDLTLSQIAFATGYGSISAFSNTFYQQTQMRPSEFLHTIK